MQIRKKNIGPRRQLEWGVVAGGNTALENKFRYTQYMQTAIKVNFRHHTVTKLSVSDPQVLHLYTLQLQFLEREASSSNKGEGYVTSRTTGGAATG